MPSLPITLLLCTLTVCVYAVARNLFMRCGQRPFLHPVFVSVAILIPVLLATGRSFEDYRPVSDVLTWPLGPATAALALPVYKQRAVLRAAIGPLAAGVSTGSLVTLTAVVACGALGGLDTPVLEALAVKSVTAAIAVELARLQGADPSLTAVLVVVTGTIGAMIGPALLGQLRVRHPVARGIALGTISHAQGTAAALAEHEASGALGSLAFVSTALFTSLLAPSYVPFLLHWFGR